MKTTTNNSVSAPKASAQVGVRGDFEACSTNPRVSGVRRAVVRRIAVEVSQTVEDFLAVEEPIEIRIVSGEADQRTERSLAVTMRTPGSDEELALGFLFNERIINSADDVTGISSHCERSLGSIVVHLAEHVKVDLSNAARFGYMSSSCGVCGKASIAALRSMIPKGGILPSHEREPVVSRDVLYGIPDTLRTMQETFAHTGGLHAAGLFDISGNLLMLREDVGRHNALDKVVGAAMRNHLLPLDHHILALSGRASFELLQKAIMADVRVIAAVGAPSSLAVDVAKDFDVTLVGFLSRNRFNVYNAPHRIAESVSRQQLQESSQKNERYSF